jgi:hypothetical protein
MIPRILHQGWWGPKPLPDRERQWCDEMMVVNITWKHKLHGKETLDRYASDNYVRHLQTLPDFRPAFLADRLRVLILRDEGGVWLDTDCKPIRSLALLNSVWDDPRIQFAYGMRSPDREGVSLHRGVSLVDNTFLASAPNSRMINRLLDCWTTVAPVVTGGMIGRQIMRYSQWDCVGLNYRYFYDMQETPDTICLHDAHNLASWDNRKMKLPVVRHGETIKL